MSTVVSKGLILLFCVLLVAQSAAAATTMVVGGSRGWTLGYDYRTWASRTSVKPYDNLVFKYNPSLHDVLVVSKADFYACNNKRPFAKFKTGTDFVKFTSPGTYYVICGVPGHCQAGMKFVVNARW